VIKVELEIEQLPSIVNGRVRGAISLKAGNHNATKEELRVLEEVMEKIKEIAKDISEEKHSEVTVWEKHYRNVRHSKSENHR
jgi:hypothetical protein